MSKTFTLDEAQTLLPVLRSLLLRARDAAVRANGFEQEMELLSQRIFLSGGLSVDVPAAARRRAEREKSMAEARSSMEEIDQAGVRVAESDGGALEFPSLAEGRIVLLCWTVSDEAIERWREDAEGSPMRPLADGPFGRERLQ